MTLSFSIFFVMSNFLSFLKWAKEEEKEEEEKKRKEILGQAQRNP